MINRKTLIICLDAIGIDKISQSSTPFLYSLSKKFGKIELESPLSFTGTEFSFFSGKKPSQHNTWLEFKKTNQKSQFKIQKLRFLPRKMLNNLTILSQIISSKNFLAKIYNIPFDVLKQLSVPEKNIWQLELFKNKKSICLKWPLLVINGRKKISFKRKDAERLKLIEKYFDKDYEIYCLQLVHADKAGHKFGAKSKQYYESIKNLDSLTEKTVKSFLGKNPESKVVLWSDHGMIDIKKYVNMNSFPASAFAFFGGTTASFWPKDKKEEAKIKSELNKLKFGKIIKNDEREKLGIPPGEEHGKIIFAMNSGNMIFPNYYESKNEKFKAMHGFAPCKEQNGFLIINQKTKIKKAKMHEALRIIEK